VIHLRAPPLEVVVRVLEREEDEHPHEGGAGVERRREHVVVLLPPRLAVPEDEEVEDGARHQPGGDVGGRGRRHPGEAVRDDGHVDECDPLLLRERPAQQPHRHGEHRADQEQPHQVAVETVPAEEPPGADQAPDHGRVERDAVLGARPGAVRVQRLHVADVLDVVQHPPRHRQVHHAGDHRPDQLRPARRAYMHV